MFIWVILNTKYLVSTSIYPNFRLKACQQGLKLPLCVRPTRFYVLFMKSISTSVLYRLRFSSLIFVRLEKFFETRPLCVLYSFLNVIISACPSAYLCEADHAPHLFIGEGRVQRTLQLFQSSTLSY